MTARSAPLTWGWLLVLLITSRIQNTVTARRRRRLLQGASTNLHHLRRDPHRVLFTSLLWMDGRQWWPYVPLYASVVAPAERRLGSARWLATGLAAHVGGTVISQAYLRRRIRRRGEATNLEHAVDVGVSYFALGIAGALTGYARRPWRSRTRAAVTAALTVNAAARPTFTEVGHLSAFLIGLVSSIGVPDRDAKPFPDTEPFRPPSGRR